MANSEEELLSKALKSQNQDKIAKAFERIYVNYAKLVSFCVGKYISDNEVIKDITNDVFLAFFQNADKVTGNIKSYLCSCAKNKSLDYLSNEKHLVFIDDMDSLHCSSDFKSASFYIELMNDLKEILTVEEIQIVELHALYGYSFKEIGQMKNISANNANVIYFRALKKFKTSKKGQKYEKR